MKKIFSAPNISENFWDVKNIIRPTFSVPNDTEMAFTIVKPRSRYRDGYGVYGNRRRNKEMEEKTG